jgi:hypothetical protein
MGDARRIGLPAAPTPRLSRREFAAAAAALAAATATDALRPRQSLAAAPPVEMTPEPVADLASYDAYIPTACKTGPFYIYTCEFDAAWAVLKTFGIDASLEEQLAAIKVDRRIEPYYVERADGVVIYGGDITRAYSGDYTDNFLARTTGAGMQRVFTHFGLRATHVSTRKRIEEHLRAGRLIWIKTTVDFKDWVPATWITPEGETVPVVLGNDHAMVVIGYNAQVAVIRDVLGPTDTNWQRPYEFEVPWETFLRCWAAQGSDGLAVGLR